MNKCPVQVDVMFQFNSKVQPIEIYPRVEVPVYSKVTVMGWGHTDPDVYMSSYVLMKIELKVWPLEECEKVYGKLPDKADSGGPLIFKGKLIGIVSAGSKYCGEKFQPEGFYTRVAAFKDWIDSHTVRRRRRKDFKCRARSSYFRKIPKY
uniref:Peptidase S1 domain-containing protein n=1 Tax=Timema poppense TaxID=170557 RepID=A0A7R9HA07_TIMPO|nr:unnamed protein product [Timema poppensis]